MDPGGCAALVENPQEALNSEGRLRRERPVCVFGPSPSDRAQTPALLTVCLTKVKQPLRVFAGIDPQGKSNNKARPQSISNPSAPKYRGFKRSPPQEAEDQSLSFSV